MALVLTLDRNSQVTYKIDAEKFIADLNKKDKIKWEGSLGYINLFKLVEALIELKFYITVKVINESEVSLATYAPDTISIIRQRKPYTMPYTKSSSGE